MNVSKKKFNKCFTVHDKFDFHIVNENARKTLCNLFDALGNISSYNDYNAFIEKYNGFSKFNKCTVSKSLKTPIELNQGILVVVDSKSGELMLPGNKQMDWFLEKYQYSTSVIISEPKELSIDSKEERVKEEMAKEDTNKEEIKHDDIKKDDDIKEDDVKKEKEEPKEEPNKKSGGFWSYFGWN